MGNNTHTFELLSGVECEVTYFTAEHQATLTRQDKRTMLEKLNDLLAMTIVRVGSETKIDRKFIDNMLAGDKKKALTEARQFSLDFQEELVFEDSYPLADETIYKHVVTIPLPEGGKFPQKPLMVLVDNPNYGKAVDEVEEGADVTNEKIWAPAQYREYNAIERKYTTVLPQDGRKVTITILDGNGEKIASGIKMKDRSSNTPIELRNPVYYEKKSDNTTEVPIKLNINKLRLKDIEHLRKFIREVEGDVDTTVSYLRVDEASRAGIAKYNQVDLLHVISFFFPSGAM